VFVDWKATGATGGGRVQNVGPDRTFGTAASRGSKAATAGLVPEFAPDATAIIYQPCRSAMSSGRAQTKHWRLRFERRRPLFIEPLMGWTGSEDPLAPVELKFPDLQAAVAYAEREGLAYQVRPAHQGHREQSVDEKRLQGAVEETLGAYLTLAWMQSQYGECELPVVPDLARALVNPAAVFRSPEDVLRHPVLDLKCKRRILQQWAWDEYLMEVASNEAMPDTAPSRLAEVKAALAKLESAADYTLWLSSGPTSGVGWSSASTTGS